MDQNNSEAVTKRDMFLLALALYLERGEGSVSPTSLRKFAQEYDRVANSTDSLSEKLTDDHFSQLVTGEPEAWGELLHFATDSKHYERLERISPAKLAAADREVDWSM